MSQKEATIEFRFLSSKSLGWEPIVTWALLLNQVLSVAILVWREYAHSAKWTLRCTVWLRPHTLVPVKISILKHGVTLVAVLVLFSILTLVKQVIIQTLDLNDLLTLPAR